MQILKIKDFIVSTDRNGLLWVTEFRHPYLNRAMEIFSRAGDWDSWTGLSLMLLAGSKKSRAATLYVLPRLLGTLAMCFTLKRFARRSRPSVAVEGFSTLLSNPDPYSFPSSHAGCSWAACISFARAYGGLAWLSTIYAVFISYSRVHVGAHYPLDVLAGTAVGVLIGLA